MYKYLKLVLFGFVLWLIPFAASFVIFPFKATMRPLFESIMPLILTITVIILVYYYLKNLDANFAKEGAIAGIVWFISFIIIDLTLFLPVSPLQMSFTEYMMDRHNICNDPGYNSWNGLYGSK